jgi:hypothetical protein
MILLSIEVNWTRVAGDATVKTWINCGRKVILSVSEIGFVWYDSADDFVHAFCTRFFIYTAAKHGKSMATKRTGWGGSPACCIEVSS